MENANNIIEMLNKINNSLHELTRRVVSLEGRVNITQQTGVNPFHNTNPYTNPMGMFDQVGTQFSHGNYSIRPQRNPQYNPQYRPQYIVNKSIDELKSIRGRLLNHFTNYVKQGLSTNDDGVFDKLHAIERTLINGLINLQHNYNIRHNDDSDLIRISKAVSNIYIKHCFNTGIIQSDIVNLNGLKHDIEELVSYWNIKIVSDNNVNISQTIRLVGKENLLDMEEWVNKTGYRYQRPTNSGIDINKLDMIKTIANVTSKLLILLLHTSDLELNKCVKLLNDYLMSNYSQLDANKEITLKHVTCNYVTNELLYLLDSYNIPNVYVYSRHISNLDKLTVDLNKFIKDYNIVTTVNQDNKPTVYKSKRQRVRKR